ncbi:MAG: imidazole glycerol phosphate synthase subunit HisH, partial [Thermoflexus sp.]
LLRGVPNGAYVYFVHGYYCDPADPADVVATTVYGIRYASVVARGAVMGVQFHPEKSHRAGEQILRNFLHL